jgi:hypothetical protein
LWQDYGLGRYFHLYNSQKHDAVPQTGFLSKKKKSAVVEAEIFAMISL